MFLTWGSEFACSQSADRPTTPHGAAAFSGKPLPSDIELKSDIVYKTVAGQAISLDLYGVKGKRYEQAAYGRVIHGGGYVGGDKTSCVGHSDIFLPLLRSMATASHPSITGYARSRAPS